MTINGLDIYYASKNIRQVLKPVSKKYSGLKSVSKKASGLKPVSKGGSCKKVGSGLKILQ